MIWYSDDDGAVGPVEIEASGWPASGQPVSSDFQAPAIWRAMTNSPRW